MIKNSVYFSILIIRLTLPVVGGLIVSKGDEIAKLENLPEYNEYLGRIRTITQQDSPLPNHPFVQFPSLCEKPPSSGDFYGHVFCWAAFSLYALLILSLIIYQLRSILWFNFKIRNKNPSSSTTATKQNGWLGDGYDQQNSEGQSPNKGELHGMFSEQSNPMPSAIPIIIGREHRSISAQT